MPKNLKVRTTVSEVRDIVLNDDDVLDDVLEELRETDTAMDHIEEALAADMATIITEVINGT